MSNRGVLRIAEGNRLGFWCPGCEEYHHIYTDPRGWAFNGDYDKPTFHPSVLVTGGHYARGWEGPKCWCTYNADPNNIPTHFKCVRCHSWVKDGKIEYLSDSSHALAGKTVDMIIYNG